MRTTGAVLAPMNAFLLLQGIETLTLRIERHVENARRVAEYLRSDDRVVWVDYAGFPESPYYERSTPPWRTRILALDIRCRGRTTERQGLL